MKGQITDRRGEGEAYLADHKTGVEATLEFLYEDCKMTTRSFALALMLRLSESTDIVETAIRCLQSFTSSMKHMAEAIFGELTRLPLQDISVFFLEEIVRERKKKLCVFFLLKHMSVV